MLTLRRALAGMLLLGAAAHAAATDRSAGVGALTWYGRPLPYDAYDPWFGCAWPYLCPDPFQLRLQLERDRRLQELREQATPPEQRIAPRSSPWGSPHYMPPPTPESNIQPPYRDASKLKPEYQQQQPAAK